MQRGEFSSPLLGLSSAFSCYFPKTRYINDAILEHQSVRNQTESFGCLIFTSCFSADVSIWINQQNFRSKPVNMLIPSLDCPSTFTFFNILIKVSNQWIRQQDIQKDPHLWLKLPRCGGSLPCRYRVNICRKPRGASRSTVQGGEAVLVVITLADGGPRQTFRRPRLVEKLQAWSEIPNISCTQAPASNDGQDDHSESGVRRDHDNTPSHRHSVKCSEARIHWELFSFAWTHDPSVKEEEVSTLVSHSCF